MRACNHYIYITATSLECYCDRVNTEWFIERVYD